MNMHTNGCCDRVVSTLVQATALQNLPLPLASLFLCLCPCLCLSLPLTLLSPSNPTFALSPIALTFFADFFSSSLPADAKASADDLGR